MKSLLRVAPWILALAVVAALVVSLRRQQTKLHELERTNAELAARNAALARAPAAAAQAAPAPAVPGHVHDDVMNKADNGEPSEAIPKGKGIKPWQHEPPANYPKLGPKPDMNNLVVSKVSAQSTANGVVSTLRFSSTDKTKPTERLALVVRLNRLSDARIIGLDPVDPANYADATQRIAEDGKFAIFQGTIKDSDQVAFNLALSSPDTADIRATCGIAPFLLDVTSSAATIKGYPAP